MKLMRPKPCISVQSYSYRQNRYFGRVSCKKKTRYLIKHTAPMQYTRQIQELYKWIVCVCDLVDAWINFLAFTIKSKKFFLPSFQTSTELFSLVSCYFIYFAQDYQYYQLYVYFSFFRFLMFLSLLNFICSQWIKVLQAICIDIIDSQLESVEP